MLSFEIEDPEIDSEKSLKMDKSDPKNEKTQENDENDSNEPKNAETPKIIGSSSDNPQLQNIVSIEKKRKISELQKEDVFNLQQITKELAEMRKTLDFKNVIIDRLETDKKTLELKFVT